MNMTTNSSTFHFFFLSACILFSLLIHAQPKGYGLLIGANKTFNPRKYDNASVAKAKEDALIIQNILMASGFQQQDIELLSDQNVTIANVSTKLKSMGKKIKKGDLFVFYFSGHGDTIPDIDHDELPYSFDQQLVLADGKITDDDLFSFFKQFKDSVRIVFIADACFSGQMYKWKELLAGKKNYYKAAYYSLVSESYSESGCDVLADSASFDMLYVGAVDRDATSEPYPDGSGRLTRWINDAWHYFKKKNLLDSISMLDFFRQACFSSSETIVTLIHSSHKNIFGKTTVFKL